jgi:predicted RNase H-like nuclease/ppGpp synthetase/RelA/SpoT-type nucleotidyltranferase
MHFVGIDLAWGEKRPSGVAVLDARGRLVHVSAQSTDESVVAALAPYAKACLVAIDAPLVVVNATGNRPCEAALNRDFARFDAGAHPSNTGKAELGGVPRGARLATALGLDIDPASRAKRRAIEVYPHPATVALFELGRTLKYKNKPGRQLAEMRSELRRLIGLLEGLGAARPALRVHDSPQWSALVAQVDAATRKSDLRRAEDQVDAVVCAYVALFAERAPARTTTYGDLATGYIVTPTLPDGLHPDVRRPPAPRAPAEPPAAKDEGGSTRDGDAGRTAVQEYAALYPDLERATDGFVAVVTTLLDDAGINYLSITGRAKAVASFAAKADRRVDGLPMYADPLREISDQIGVRVITYLHSDVAAVADLLSDQLTVLDDRDMGQETASEGRFGYASRHLLLTPTTAPGSPGASSLGERSAQVQIRTVLQHAWAEFEHDVRYKGSIPAEHAPELDRRFTLAAGLLELADREFSTIRDRLRIALSDQHPEADDTDPRISAQDLATFLDGRFADAGWSRTDHYAWISGLLLELGITSLDELSGLLSSIDTVAINARMGYRYPAGAVRRLDDALLAVFGSRYLGLHGNTHREELLRARLEKVRASTDPGSPGQNGATVRP